MKLAFAGTPDFAATILRGLLGSDHEVGLVISQPDRPRGRGRKLTRSPVAELAADAGLPLKQPDRISEVADEISTQDALVVAAYGQILRADTLYAAPLGAWNVHASLLPRYRGAAPIERAIMAGEEETGVSFMRMDEGLDTGPFALQLRTGIPADMTGGELTSKLARLGIEAVVQSMSRLSKNSLTLTEQDNDLATYAPKLEDEERVIRWGENVRRVHDLVRALTPHIGSRTHHPDFPGPIKVLRARISERNASDASPGSILPAKERILVACGEGALEVLELQAPGSKALSAQEFLRGRRLEGSFLA
jgi:methionyl-tRNA formyltransferase